MANLRIADTTIGEEPIALDALYRVGVAFESLDPDTFDRLDFGGYVSAARWLHEVDPDMFGRLVDRRSF